MDIDGIELYKYFRGYRKFRHKNAETQAKEVLNFDLQKKQKFLENLPQEYRNKIEIATNSCKPKTMDERSLQDYLIQRKGLSYIEAQKKSREILAYGFFDRLQFKLDLPEEYKVKIFGEKVSAKNKISLKYRDNKDKTLLNVFLAIMFFAVYPSIASYVILTNDFMGITNLLIFGGGELVILGIFMEVNGNSK